MRRFSVKGATACALSLAATLSLAPFAVADDGATPTPATPKAAASPGVDDPLEPLNRVTSGFNAIVRGAIIDPLVDGYKAVTPDPVQQAVSNAVSNLSEPVTVGSSLLQGDTDNAA
ncbi:MAG TPA: MlaA family lipoprotein, partial [Rhodospirillales bacterium]